MSATTLRRGSILISTLLLAIIAPVMTATNALADVVDNGASVVQIFGCNGPDTGSGFQYSGGYSTSSTDGYDGPDVIGSSSAPDCSSSFPYKLSVSGSSSTALATWSYGNSVHSVSGKTCKYWAYIPAIDAGGPNAKYFVFSQSSTDSAHYLFNTVVNQENWTGWKYLGSVTIPSGYYGTYVTLNNSEPSSPGWDVAFDSVAFHCV